MNIRFLVTLVLGLCFITGLAGCESDPMKPRQPNGRRFKVNLVPPPVMPLEVTPQTQTESIQSDHSHSKHPPGGNE